jgi:hypothetical protein
MEIDWQKEKWTEIHWEKRTQIQTGIQIKIRMGILMQMG